MTTWYQQELWISNQEAVTKMLYICTVVFIMVYPRYWCVTYCTRRVATIALGHARVACTRVPVHRAPSYHYHFFFSKAKVHVYNAVKGNNKWLSCYIIFFLFFIFKLEWDCLIFFFRNITEHENNIKTTAGKVISHSLKKKNGSFKNPVLYRGEHPLA